MSVQIKPETPTKGAVSVSQMCRLLKMSRSQFYWHVKKGTFHAPLKLPSNGRPYFTAALVEENLRAKATSVGVGGEFVIFYERQALGDKPSEKKPKATSNDSLIESLKSLGLQSVTSDQIESAKVACYPHGTNGDDEATVLRAIFRHLRRMGVG